MERNPITRSGPLNSTKMLPVRPKSVPLVASLHFSNNSLPNCVGNRKITATQAMKITQIRALNIHLAEDTKTVALLTP
uniref:Uncharacterized protein n=1 Tax=Rhizophora mucronata TaxID=61149 RepID=A0A2P2JPK2_RHIMU